MEDSKNIEIENGFEFCPKAEDVTVTNGFICTKCSPTFRDERALQQHHINNHLALYRCRVKVNIPNEFHEKCKEKLLTNGNVAVKIDKLSTDRNHVLYLTPYQLRVLTGMCSKNYKKSITFYLSKRQVKYNLQQKDGYLHDLLTNNL